jgi:hypothetical protein
MKRLIRAINRLFTEKAPKTRMKAEDVLTVARLYMQARAGQLEEPVYLSMSAEGRTKRLVWLVRDNADTSAKPDPVCTSRLPTSGPYFPSVSVLDDRGTYSSSGDTYVFQRKRCSRNGQIGQKLSKKEACHNQEGPSKVEFTIIWS